MFASCRESDKTYSTPLTVFEESKTKAEQGDATAQFNLGVCYAYGDGVSEDQVEAVKWYRKAAEQGIVDAQVNLGICYSDGDGVSQDQEEAVKWYRKAAEQGNTSAQFFLADSYETGKGVERNIVEAYAYYNLASVSEKAIRRIRDSLEEEMSNEQIADAQRRTRELLARIKAKNYENK